MLLQPCLHELAESLVILRRLDGWKAPYPVPVELSSRTLIAQGVSAHVKGVLVEVANGDEVLVRADTKRKVLHRPYTMSDAYRKLGSDKVGGLQQALLVHFATEEGELSQTYRCRLPLGVLLDELFKA